MQVIEKVRRGHARNPLGVLGTIRQGFHHVQLSRSNGP